MCWLFNIARRLYVCDVVADMLTNGKFRIFRLSAMLTLSGEELRQWLRAYPNAIHFALFHFAPGVNVPARRGV